MRVIYLTTYIVKGFSKTGKGFRDVPHVQVAAVYLIHSYGG